MDFSWLTSLLGALGMGGGGGTVAPAGAMSGILTSPAVSQTTPSYGGYGGLSGFSGSTSLFGGGTPAPASVPGYTGLNLIGPGASGTPSEGGFMDTLTKALQDPNTMKKLQEGQGTQGSGVSGSAAGGGAFPRGGGGAPTVAPIDVALYTNPLTTNRVKARREAKGGGNPLDFMMRALRG